MEILTMSKFISRLIRYNPYANDTLGRLEIHSDNILLDVQARSLIKISQILVWIHLSLLACFICLAYIAFFK